ncbi:hypothetical protein RF11_05426 [Thelohanellus kitauei]|uniref:Uncharacterized protein n=1 Tax=Thelohanellus kitauei TaxID=669202 RepID=A0A0C2IJ60_THEKT|nr:hypothetical protein RF11_05426 [Thelohanellus kitauei]
MFANDSGCVLFDYISIVQDRITFKRGLNSNFKFINFYHGYSMDGKYLISGVGFSHNIIEIKENPMLSDKISHGNQFGNVGNMKIDIDPGSAYPELLPAT